MYGKVGIILVNYNGGQYIVDCINSLMGQTYGNIAILFWDNGSDDDSVRIVREMYPQIHLIQNKVNYGFAKANNLAVKKMYQLEKDVEYVLLLNVDTIADPILVECLLQKADMNTVTTAHICMGSHAQSIWYAGGQLQLDAGKAVHCYTRNCVKEMPVTFMSGCCMMIHTNIIRRYGLFDSAYYMYYEDTDLCMRWYLHGVRMYYVPGARLWHKVGGCIGGIKNSLKEYYLTRNRLYFVNKYARYIQMNRIQLICKIMKSGLLGGYDYEMTRACCLGVIDFYLGRMERVKHRI